MGSPELKWASFYHRFGEFTQVFSVIWRSVVTLSDIQDARPVISNHAIRTPLVRFNVDSTAEIYLKLENLQPIGSFKIRGAANAIARLSPRDWSVEW